MRIKTVKKAISVKIDESVLKQAEKNIIDMDLFFCDYVEFALKKLNLHFERLKKKKENL